MQNLTSTPLGPGVLGPALQTATVTWSSPGEIQSLDRVAGWAVMLFVWFAPIELDLLQTWRHQRKGCITVG
jgi:hypothetical protein